MSIGIVIGGGKTNAPKIVPPSSIPTGTGTTGILISKKVKGAQPKTAD